MSVTNSLSLANCIVIADLCKGLVTNFYVLFKHLKHNVARLDTRSPSLSLSLSTYHRFVGDMTILIETRLALLLLGGHVVGDEGVVALLAEGVLALDLLLVHRLLHLHQLLDAPHVLLLLGGLLLLPGVQLWLLWVFVPLRVSAGVRSHRVSELVEENSVISAAGDLSRGLVPAVSLLALLLAVGIVVVLLLLLLEILLLLEVAVGLLVVVELSLLFVVELLGLSAYHWAALRPLGVLLQTNTKPCPVFPGEGMIYFT